MDKRLEEAVAGLRDAVDRVQKEYTEQGLTENYRDFAIRDAIILLLQEEGCTVAAGEFILGMASRALRRAATVQYPGPLNMET